MSTSAPRASDGHYHHGTLRPVLLRITLEMLASGDDVFSIRSVARKAGVSVTAIYHHYPSREGLLAAAGRVGFEQLHQLLEMIGDRGEPADVFSRLVQAYVNFGNENRRLFNLMLDRVLKAAYPELEVAAHDVFEHLNAWLVRNFAIPDHADRSLRVLCLWFVMQGIASLRLSHAIGQIDGQVAGDVARHYAANLLGPDRTFVAH